MENLSQRNENSSVYRESSEVNPVFKDERIAGDNESVNANTKKTTFGRKLVNSATIGGIALAQAKGGVSAINAQRLAEQRNSAENNPPITEQYRHSDYKNEQQEFIDHETRSSGLDDEGFPIDKEVIIQDNSQDRIESCEAFYELIPSLDQLNEYELIESEALDSYQEVKIISDYFNIYSFPLKEDMFPAETFRVSTVDLEEYINQRNGNSWGQLGDQELQGLGFSIKNIITLEGPEGDKVQLGEYHNHFGWYTRTYLLMGYQDKEGQEYAFTTDSFPEEEKVAYGKIQNSFLEISHQLYDDIVRGEANGIETQEYELDRELETGFVKEVYDVQDLRELEAIAEDDKSVRVILGITEAINSYPGDEVVTEEYLEQMYKDNKEKYGFDAIQLEDKSLRTEKMTQYLLNYVDQDGNSWYRDYLDFQDDIQTWYEQHLELKRNPWGYNTYYHDRSRMIRDLNLLSSGIKIEEKNVQPFGVANLYRNLIGLPAPMVMSAPVENVRDLIPEEISQYDGGYFFSNMIKDTYISPHFEDYSNIMVGDMLVSQEKNHLITIFYESENEEGSTKWAFDVDNKGMVRLYQWNNDGKRLYPIGPLSSPYGRYDLLRHVKNMPYDWQRKHWEVKYNY
jgi:hypothetical protein